MKKFLVSLLIILLSSVCWAAPPAPIPPIRTTDCTPFIADGVMCYNTSTDKFYIGNGTAAIEIINASTFIFPAAGVPVYDTNSSHVLYLKAGSDIIANKNLTFTTGDSDRTITLSGNPTLADWFDQAVKAASTPTFGGLTITGLAGYVKATAGVLSAGSIADGDLPSALTGKTYNGLTLTSAADGFTILGGTTGRTLTVTGGSPTIGDYFDQAVKAASAVTFATVDTGQGANELYDMDQNVLTSSTPQFAGLTLSTDTILSRKTAANFQFGAADAATPIAQGLSVQSVVAGTVDTAGVNWTFKGSMGTGTGAGGSLIFQTSPAAAGTGNTQNTPVTALTIGPTGRVTVATTDDYGLVFGSLGTATRGIDLSGSGLSGEADYWIYNSSTNMWGSSGIIDASSHINSGGRVSVKSGIYGAGVDLLVYSDPGYNNLINVKSTLAQTSTLFGDRSTYAVGSYTSVTFPTASKVTITKTGIGTAVGNPSKSQLIHITGGTAGAGHTLTRGHYRIATYVDADNITVDRNIHDDDENITDGTVTVYKDILGIFAYDANGIGMRAFGGTVDKPLVLGGTVNPASTNLVSTDVIIAGNIGLSQTQAASNQAGLLATVHTAGNPGIYFKVIDPATGTAYAVPGWAIP